MTATENVTVTAADTNRGAWRFKAYRAHINNEIAAACQRIITVTKEEA